MSGNPGPGDTSLPHSPDIFYFFSIQALGLSSSFDQPTQFAKAAKPSQSCSRFLVVVSLLRLSCQSSSAIQSTFPFVGSHDCVSSSNTCCHNSSSWIFFLFRALLFSSTVLLPPLIFVGRLRPSARTFQHSHLCCLAFVVLRLVSRCPLLSLFTFFTTLVPRGFRSLFNNPVNFKTFVISSDFEPLALSLDDCS